MDSCEVDGDVRTLSTMGMEIKEQLRELDDGGRRISYGIVHGPVPVEHHHATVSVEPAGSASHVTWAVEVRPDEMLGAFVPIYQQSLEALKQKLET
jgi:hypothetical protein